MKRIVITVLAVIALVSFAYASETLKDNKGYYELNQYGSKCRLSQKDYDLKKQGLPYGATLAAEDISVKEAKVREQEAQQQAIQKKQQEKEDLINKKKEELLRQQAIDKLKIEGKLDINGNIPGQ